MQYTLNNLYIYDLNLLKIQDYTQIYNNYILKNHKLCEFQFKNIINKQQ